MICLSIETTSRFLGVSLFSFAKKGRPMRLRSLFEQPAVKQSDVLVPTLDRMLKRERLKPSDLSLIAVNVGPGSFTGVRVGLSTARTMAQALKIPLAGVDSLEAMAWSSPLKNSSAVLVPSIPASAGEVYFAAYCGEKTLSAPAWKTERDRQTFLDRHKDAVTLSEPVHPDALAEIAIARYQSRRGEAPFHFENVVPLYLQPSWAERAKKSR